MAAVNKKNQIKFPKRCGGGPGPAKGLGLTLLQANAKWRPFLPRSLISRNWQRKSVGNFVTRKGICQPTPSPRLQPLAGPLSLKIVDAVSIVLD